MSGRRVTDHGTYAAYKRGCRCPACSAYQAGRVAANRADRLARLQATDDIAPALTSWQAPIGHGTRSAYDAGCRCEPCRGARKSRYDDAPEVPAGAMTRGDLARYLTAGEVR